LQMRWQFVVVPVPFLQALRSVDVDGTRAELATADGTLGADSFHRTCCRVGGVLQRRLSFSLLFLEALGLVDR